MLLAFMGHLLPLCNVKLLFGNNCYYVCLAGILFWHKDKTVFLYKALHGGACLLLFNCTVGCHQMSDAALGIVPGCVGRKQWELTPLSVMDNSWMTSRQFNGLLSRQCQSVGIMDNRNLVDRHLNWLAGLKWVCICVWDHTGIKVIFAALP